MFPFVLKGLRQVTKLRVLLGVLLFYSGAFSAEQQITAGWVETKLDQLGHSRTYVGKVSFDDAVNHLKIGADSAVVRDGQYLFLSNLKFADSTRTVEANKLVYDSAKHFAQFEGQVTLREGQRSLSAENVHVWPDSQQVKAWGNAVVDLLAQEQRVVAQAVTLGDSKEAASATGNVVATLFTQNENPLQILTDSLRFLAEEERVWFVGNAKVRQSNLVLTTPSGYYADSLLHAFKNPKMQWVESGQGDSVWAQSERMVVQIEDQTIRKLHLHQYVKINLWGHRDSLQYVQSIQGDSVIAEVNDQKLSAIAVFGNPQLHFERGTVDIRIQGDSMSVWFNNGRLDSLWVMGAVRGHLFGSK